ncbi:thiamine pyrophosphate-binding protein [Roseomonas sp. NAR14]|uniref:Thiamine pyrophosphate-binding protein n=1 Tax=Roseomonas acroporae TaxID=2937791 RepID=A0A9X1Y5A8_9PROT|nr:thiamine pyrophosphate-binding protein [Roseomonas acroporae]MCK8783723.1 thiamine pyrophosphate-binding protein [Roseomonas acroporae]
MSGSYDVGDLVAEFLARIGVRTAFGIVSVHNIPMLDGIARRNAIRFVMARGEMGGGHMADAYARVSGGLGVLFSSTGPGAANAMGGLAEARFAGSPVLHLTGATATRFAGRDMGTVHDLPGQSAMLGAVCKAVHQVRSAEQALGVLVRAATEALTAPRGPVSVEIPIDIQRTAIARPEALDTLILPLPPPQAPDPAELDVAADLIAQARRPILWLGNGAREAGQGARALLELGFGAVSSWNGRGILAEDEPMHLGGLNGNGAPLVQEFYGTADLLLVAGSRLRGHELADFSVRLPRNVVQIDVDPAARGRTCPSAAFVHGDAGLALEGLALRLRGRLSPDPEFGTEFRAMRERARAAFRDTLGPYADFPAMLREAMPRDAAWVRDVTISNSSWGNRLFPVYGPRDAVHPVSAAIGPGLPLGIGAAIAAGESRPGRRTVAMVGDGGFALNLPELWTAAQERPDLVVLVMNDRGYGVIRHIQDALYGGRRNYGDLLGPDLEGLAKLAGLPFHRVAEATAFGDTMRRALATAGPVLVEVDMNAIGPHPPYSPYDKR